MSLSKKIGVIGTGRVGTFIGAVLKQKGYHFIAGSDLKKENVQRFYRLLKLKYRKLDNIDIARNADLIFITTPDLMIEKIYYQILPYLQKGKTLIQCSGALSNNLFKGAKRKGLITIGLHPVQTFPSVKPKIGARNFYYAVEADARARVIAKRIVADLDGKLIFIPAQDKPLYHAMCVFASNYLVALMSSVLEIAQVLKIRPNLALTMLEPLIKQTLDNIQQYGVKKSLTGPIERGDLETVKSHLVTLEKNLPKLLPLYQTLGLKILRLVNNK